MTVRPLGVLAARGFTRYIFNGARRLDRQRAVHIRLRKESGSLGTLTALCPMAKNFYVLIKGGRVRPSRAILVLT